MLLAEVAASHCRSREQIRQLFEAANRILCPGGVLIFSAFIAHDGYKPDEFVRQISQVMCCCVFTKGEILGVISSLPFDLDSNESTARELR